MGERGERASGEMSRDGRGGLHSLGMLRPRRLQVLTLELVPITVAIVEFATSRNKADPV